MATLLIHHPIFARHLVPFGHPERPERIAAVEAALALPAFDALIREEAVELQTLVSGRLLEL